jgi:hypothetical protein
MYETNLSIRRFQDAYPQTVSRSRSSGNFDHVLNHVREQSPSQNTAKVSASHFHSASSSTNAVQATDVPSANSSAGNTLATLVFEILSEFLSSAESAEPGNGPSAAQRADGGNHSHAQRAEGEETSHEKSSTEYVFHPGYFTALQELVRQELAKGNDPEVTLDGPWRWHDAEGKLLPKPIPIYIEGHPERPVGSDVTYWVGGPDPYTAFWITEGSEAENEELAAVDASEEEKVSDSSSTDQKYVFHPGYFTALQELVQQELAKGNDPEVTLDGPWRWHDAEGKLLPKPIPIYIEGHPERPVGSDVTYWVGGPDPYTAFWLNEDSESAKA